MSFPRREDEGHGTVLGVPASTAGRGVTNGKSDLWFDLVNGRKPGEFYVVVLALGSGGLICWEKLSTGQVEP